MLFEWTVVTLWTSSSFFVGCFFVLLELHCVVFTVLTDCVMQGFLVVVVVVLLKCVDPG